MQKAVWWSDIYSTYCTEYGVFSLHILTESHTNSCLLSLAAMSQLFSQVHHSQEEAEEQ